MIAHHPHGLRQRLGVRFATKLKNAQLHLFTFLRYEDVEPTNNAAGTALKAAVRQGGAGSSSNQSEA
ncbi:hypothetical protein CENSYa_0134 [Cenarchaeum symbiosum A]|uniref:Transposase n=1 Tax=Cenarchaeum symbiosum (strain A) TaxID=414004 RepID=A0RTW2_CENSY|nr:hypothetical protein CENSYa_0134 [Cenarchaeum symbiosum A]